MFRELRDSDDPFTAAVDREPKHRLFNSCSHADKDVVREAYEKVRSRLGPDVLVDYDGRVNPGMILHRDLTTAARERRAVSAVVSAAYMASPACCGVRVGLPSPLPASS